MSVKNGEGVWAVGERMWARRGAMAGVKWKKIRIWYIRGGDDLNLAIGVEWGLMTYL